MKPGKLPLTLAVLAVSGIGGGATAKTQPTSPLSVWRASRHFSCAQYFKTLFVSLAKLRAANP